MNKSITIYSLLKIANIFVFILMILVYQSEGETDYVNYNSILLGSLMMLITHLLLTDAQKQHNPILVVMALSMIAYFELRIVTLTYTDFSVVLNRTKMPKNGINNSLLFIILAYIAAWIAFRYKKPKGVQNKTSTVYKRNATKNLLIFLFFSLGLSLASSLGIPGVSQAMGILSTFFFNMFFMMLFSIVYFLYNKEVTKKYKFFFLLFLLIYLVSFTILGSRSTILKIFTTTLFALLALDIIKIKIIYVTIVSIVIPIAVYFFILSTFARGLDAKNLSRQEQMEIFTMVSNRITGNEIKTVLSPVFDRMGYLDYATEMIYNRPHLSEYLNIPNYVKSVVDNLLTPGFNIFDMPKMSNVISKSYIYKGTPSVSKYGVSGDSYQSDVMTLWGEMYLLFGQILAIPILFLFCFSIKRFFVKHLKRKTIGSIWIRAIIILEVNTLVLSMGLDWIVIDIVALSINYWIFKKITVDTEREKLMLQRNGI